MLFFLKILMIFVVSFPLWGGTGSFQVFLKKWHGREVHVYLPVGYERPDSQKYPVLFVHDGQNLYDPSRAYMGQTWNAEKILNEMIRKKLMKPIVVVAIDNSPKRMDEYTPDYDAGENAGGGADAYLELILNDLRPVVLKSLKVSDAPNKTGIMGSSLGGLVSLYAGIKHPEVFGLVAALSPSIWWNQASIVKRARNASELPAKIYLDSGTVGGERPEDVLMLENVLKQRHLAPYVYVQPGADHSERFWAMRLPLALSYLFPMSKKN